MITIFDHPLITQKLTMMRDQTTSHTDFRRNLNEIASLMVYNVLADYKLQPRQVTTPTGRVANGGDFAQEIIIVPILRAGLGMVQGIQNLIPQAKVGHIGMYRDEVTFQAHEYFYKMPNVPKDALMLVVDPMLATGTSATDAITKLKADKFTTIKLICLVGVQAGIDKIQKHHPEVDIFLAAKDPELNAKKYIIPGLGDAGDRIFGTK